MENTERCFFCCKFLPQDHNNFSGKFEYSNDSIHCDITARTTFNCEKVKEQVLRISQYLKVSKTVLEEETSDVTTSIIKTCVDCTEISENLSILCIQLEQINLKISHYFNLLADQILEIPNDEEDEDADQLQLSDFQKLVHEKCLFKVQQDNCDLQSDHEESRNSAVQNLVGDNDDTTNSSVILEESNISNEIKIEIKTEEDDQDQLNQEQILSNEEINSELHSCPFCDFLVQGPYNLLHSHITAQHPEHFETSEEPENTSIQIDIPSSSSQKPENSNKLKCEKCNKYFLNMWNIRRHMITIHGRNNRHRGPKILETTPNKPNKTLSSCDLCGTVTSTLGLAKHQQLFCRARINKDTAPPPPPTQKKKGIGRFKCGSCGTSFVNRGNLRRHIREIASCSSSAGTTSEFTNLINDRFQCSNCNKMYSRLDYIKKHIENECKSGLLIDNDTGRKLSLEDVSKEISKCEFCGMNVYTRNLRKHVDLKHNKGLDKKSGKKKEETCEYCGRTCGHMGNLRVHMLAAHGIEMPKGEQGRRIFKCGGCGKEYNIRRSWRRHLQNNERCRLKAGGLEKNGEGEEEEEREVILSIPEMGTEDNSLLEMLEDANGPGEDPLQI